MLVTLHRAARNYAAAGREQSLIVSRRRISFILNLYVTLMNAMKDMAKGVRVACLLWGVTNSCLIGFEDHTTIRKSRLVLKTYSEAHGWESHIVGKLLLLFC